MHAKKSVPRPGNAPPDPSLTFGGPSLRSSPPSQYPAAVPQYTGQEQPPYAPADRNATSVRRPVDATGAGLVQPSRTREAHLGDHRATAVPVTASSSRQTTASRKDIGGPEIEADTRPRGSQPPVGAGNSQSAAIHPASYSNPSGGSAAKPAQSRIGRHEAVTSPGPTLSNALSARTSQETRGDASFGPPRMEAPRKSDRSPLPQTDPHRDRNENRSRAQQLDRTPSVQSSSQSFTYPPPSLNRQNVSTSPSPSPAAPALTKTASIRMQAPQGTHPGGPQVRYGEAPSDLSRPYDERNAKAYAEETRYANPSAAPLKQHSQPHPTVPPVGHPSRPHPAPDPRRLDKDNSCIQGIEGIDREAKRPTDELTSDKVRKRGPVYDERATNRDDYITPPGTAPRRKAEPNPTSGHAPDTARYPNAPPPGSSMERAYSSSATGAYGVNAPHLPATGDPRRQVGQSTALASPSGGPQAYIAPPPPVFLSSPSEPKHVIRVPSNQGPIAPGTAPIQGTRSPHGPSAPPLSYPRPSDDFASRASREAQLESKAGPVGTSPLAHQPDHLLASHNAPSTQTRRDKGADASLGFPGDRSAGSHYPHVSTTPPHDYANSKGPSMEQPSGNSISIVARHLCPH
ncbi:hypothetical protein BC826DRAFT_1188044 [Russula brevipes]|nr:hypothetical protein BC826DRAFT_1188044 [Russula brevipes]